MRRGDFSESFPDDGVMSSSRALLCSVQTAAVNEDPVHIAWSSSDGEQSDDETQEQQQQLPQRPARPSAPAQSYSRALRMLRTEKGTFRSHGWDRRDGLMSQRLLCL